MDRVLQPLADALVWLIFRLDQAVIRFANLTDDEAP